MHIPFSSMFASMLRMGPLTWSYDPLIVLIVLVDCVRAEPVIYKKFESSERKFTLLRAYVGDRPTWRNPSHPWRLDKRFELKGVPTLMLWQNGGVAGRLEDHEAHLENRIEKLLSIATSDASSEKI